MKDKAAMSTQWLSVHLPLARAIPSFESTEDLKVLEAVRHTNKLRRGHAAANRFVITIRDVPPGGAERARTTLETLRRIGVPNRFGPQRFGIDGDNAERALRFLRGETRPPRGRRVQELLISALQAEVFNRILDLRIERDLFTQALAGDVMKKHQSGGVFVVEDPEAETERVKRLEISPTGWMPGKRAKPATLDAGALEAEALRDSGLEEKDLRKMRDGTRRLLRYPLDPDASIEPVGDDAFRLHVTLPSGAYATVLLDELIKPPDAPFTRARP